MLKAIRQASRRSRAGRSALKSAGDAWLRRGNDRDYDNYRTFYRAHAGQVRSSMKKISVFRFWQRLGTDPALMASRLAARSLPRGGVQRPPLLVAEGGAEHSRPARQQAETLAFLAPLVADQALVGDYAAIGQLLKNQVQEGRDRPASCGPTRTARQLVAQDSAGQARRAGLVRARCRHRARRRRASTVTAGGVGYGTLSASDDAGQGLQPALAAVHQAAADRGGDAVPHAAVHLADLPRQPRHAAHARRGREPLQPGRSRSAHRRPKARPKCGLAAEAFNNMAEQHRGPDLPRSAKSESKNKLLATIVEQSSEAIWTTDLAGNITSWNSGAAAMFGYAPAEAMGRALKVGESTPEEEQARMQRLVAGEKFSYDAKAMTAVGRRDRHPGRRRASARRRQPAASAASPWRATSRSTSAARKRCAWRAGGGSGQPREELVPRHG